MRFAPRLYDIPRVVRVMEHDRLMRESQEVSDMYVILRAYVAWCAVCYGREVET